MRSDSAEELKKLEANILPLMQQAADEENRRWEAKPEQQIKVELKLVGDRPAGAQAYESPVVDTARAALGTAGLEAKSIVASSTDSNLPISLGIPAATLGGGGRALARIRRASGISRSMRGRPQKLLLTVLGLVGVQGFRRAVARCASR